LLIFNNLFEMKGCRIAKAGNGYTVKGTFFKNYDHAKLYAFYVAIVLKNHGKLIYINSVEEAINEHNRLEGKTNDEWLRLCWKRNANCYLHTKNIYALRHEE